MYSHSLLAGSYPVDLTTIMERLNNRDGTFHTKDFLFVRTVLGEMRGIGHTSMCVCVCVYVTNAHYG